MSRLIRFADGMDAVVVAASRWAAWLYLMLVLVVLAQVVLRYFFHHGLVALEELMWHLYAVAFLFGLSFALVRDAHVRVDLIHARFSPRMRAAIEIIGILLLVLPLVLVVVHHSLAWVELSYRLNESSQSPGGLPHRWLIKSAIPVAMGLVGLAAIGRVARELAVLMSRSHKEQSQG